MFERARTNSASTNADTQAEDEFFEEFAFEGAEFTTPEGTFEEVKQTEEQKRAFEEFKFSDPVEERRFFEDYLVSEAETAAVTFSQQFTFELVDYINAMPDYRVIQMFKSIQKDKRMRAYRRLARIIHPDKNAHILAKDAFQKLLLHSSCLRPL